METRGVPEISRIFGDEVADEVRRQCSSAKATQVQIVEITERLNYLLNADPAELARFTPSQFERFVAGRLDRMGYDVTLTGSATAKDGGIDLIALPKHRTFGSFLLAGQVKHHSSGAKTGRAAVDRLLAWRNSNFRLGLLVTNTEFTRDARWLAELEQHRAFLRLRDFEDLKRWMQNDFSADQEHREIPSRIELAPGLWIQVPPGAFARDLQFGV